MNILLLLISTSLILINAIAHADNATNSSSSQSSKAVKEELHQVLKFLDRQLDDGDQGQGQGQFIAPQVIPVGMYLSHGRNWDGENDVDYIPYHIILYPEKPSIGESSHDIISYTATSPMGESLGFHGPIVFDGSRHGYNTRERILHDVIYYSPQKKSYFLRNCTSSEVTRTCYIHCEASPDGSSLRLSKTSGGCSYCYGEVRCCQYSDTPFTDDNKIRCNIPEMISCDEAHCKDPTKCYLYKKVELAPDLESPSSDKADESGGSATDPHGG